jgi:altronate dehydratase
MMMNVRTSTVGLATAATIAAATVLISGAVVADSHLEHFTRGRGRISSGQPLIRNVTKVDRTLPA